MSWKVDNGRTVTITKGRALGKSETPAVMILASPDPKSKKRLYVYWSSNGRKWSVVCDGRVHPWKPYTNVIQVHNPKFVVREGGYKRALKENRKNVHAFVTGSSLQAVESIPTNAKRVSYNFRKSNKFLDELGNPVEQAQTVWLSVQEGRPIAMFT